MSNAHEAATSRGQALDFTNARAALVRRRQSGELSWEGPAAMLFARSLFAVIAAALVAGIMSFRGSATPWRDAAVWFPVYATLIDAGCLALLWLLLRREGVKLSALFGFHRKRVGGDILLGLVLIGPSLVLILGGVAVSSLLVYGSPLAPMSFEHLPLAATLYGVIVFPLLWGFTEQATYNGYLAPRLEVLGGTRLAVLLVALSWSFQHAVMPVRFDGAYMLYRALAPVPFSIFAILVYLRLRRILPIAIAHWLMDAASVFLGSLWPLLH